MSKNLIMKPLVLSILTGILLGTSYIPFPPWALFFFFVPLWICWFEEKSKWRIFWTGLLAQLIFNLIGFNWVAYTMHEFGHLPWALAVLILVLFCAIANLYVPIVGLLWFLICKRWSLPPLVKLWMLPLLCAIGVRVSPMIFDWNAGYSWYWADFPAYHLADIFGFLGLDTITLFFNGLIFTAWWMWRESKMWWPTALAMPVLFAVLNLAGMIHGRGWTEADAKLKFLLVQANIENQEKLQAEKGWAFRDVVINRWVDLTVKGVSQGRPDFAVWPETAFPEVIPTPTLEAGYPLKLKRAITSMGTKLITGGYGRHEGNGRYTNSFFILGENGEWLTKPYHKTILLAFGEYFPLADYFPKLRQWFPEVGDYGRGPGPTVMNVAGVKIGAQICYEGLFDWFSRDLANAGAQVLVNVTNDSWYGKWEQPYQHGYMTFARAVELRRPLVRSTNTGLSSVALASGEVMTQSPLHEPWFHLYEVPYMTNPQPTIFMGWGYWLFPGILAMGVFVVAAFVFKSRSERRRS